MLIEEVIVASRATKTTTLLDIAQKAGVSHQTVSRVINHHPNVAHETRERVLQLIRDLNYQPNQVARSLATRRSRTIGIISYGTTFYGPAQMLTNIEKSFREQEYGLALSMISDLSFEELYAAISDLKSRSVDGIIIISPILDLKLTQVKELCTDLPFVMVDIALGEQMPSVVIDQRYAGKMATRHLIELGHSQISEISGPLNWCDARLRHEGWLAALAEASLEPVLSIESDWSAAGGYAAAQQLLKQGRPFTGLVVGNDQMSLGAIKALKEHNINVPHEVSIVGFDNVPESAFFDPPLTTIKQDFSSLGRQSAEYLIALIERPDRTPLHQRVLYPELVVRQSTKERGEAR